MHFPSVATPSSQRPSAQATLATTDRAGATIDTAVFTISAVQPGSISGTWASKNGVPGITSDVNVELTSSGAISAGGALEIVLPSSHGWSFLTDYPAISFVQPSSVIANASWNGTQNILNVIIASGYLPPSSVAAPVSFTVHSVRTPPAIRDEDNAQVTTRDRFGTIDSNSQLVVARVRPSDSPCGNIALRQQ